MKEFQWVSAKERLPSAGSDVLVADKQGYIYHAFYSRSGDWAKIASFIDRVKFPITH